MYTPHSVYPFSYQWTLGWLPPFGYLNNAAVDIGVSLSLLRHFPLVTGFWLGFLSPSPLPGLRPSSPLAWMDSCRSLLTDHLASLLDRKSVV